MSGAETPGDRDHRYACAARGRRHRARELPETALLIDATFPGDDEVGAGDTFGESDRAKDELGT